MKFVKKATALVICAIMLATSVAGEGWFSLVQSIKASALAGHEQSYDDARVELDFNKGWKFSLGDDSAAHLKGFDDSAWEDVDLPHDFSISQGFTENGTEGESGNLPGGTGWYRKWFNLYDYYTGDRIILNFDGVYQHAYVYVNGQFVGENHYGYNSFSFEISEYLICSNTSLNLIAIKVVNEIPSSRWYSGSGINRDVTLTITSPVHVSLYGPQITTPDVENGDGTVNADITIHNSTAITKKVTVETTILDKNHKALSETVTSSLITVPAETEQSLTLRPSISSPELWSPESPNIYKLKTVIKGESGEVLDEYHTTFGYRYVEWNKDKGFSLNGENIKLKGVCLHHDQGALGAVQEYEAIYRQIVILKDMGCNAIRTSHNTAPRVIIDICNELGMLVLEEFFDGWDVSKNGNINDFSKYFYEDIPSSNTAIGSNGQKWFEFAVEQTILRDRHDPCIIAWDVGNELSGIDSNSTPNYQAIVESIVDIRDELDPARILLQGNNNAGSAANEMVDSYMDVVGTNYAPSDWVLVMHNTEDSRYGKPFVATESASSINSRGVYNTMTYYDFQCTSYDTNAVSWGNEAAEAWYTVIINDDFSGEFVWTGFDYIGEPTPWNNYTGPHANSIPNSSYFGIVDTAGFAKDSYYLYRSLWNDESTTLHLVPGSWNSDNLLLNNGYVNVAVYSNAKKIELLLNGNVIATATSTVNRTDGGFEYRTWTESITDYSNCSVGNFYTGNGADFYPQFSVKYAEGALSVKAYDENNTEITDTVGSTKSVSGVASQIFVDTWQSKDTYVADGADYIYLEFEARDADGNFMNDYNGTLDFKVGDDSARYAEIVGVDNGNAATTDKFQQPSALLSGSHAEIKMFNGRALVILKTTEEEGTINFTATASDGTTSFSTKGVTVTSEKEKGAELTDEFEEVVTQNGDEYEVTLYDKYEMVKLHINELDPPKEGSGSGSDDSGASGDDELNILYEIFLPDSTAPVPDGDYVIYNYDIVMTTGTYQGWCISATHDIENEQWAPTGSAYSYQRFGTSDNNVFTFTHIEGNQYYVVNKSTGLYVKIDGYNNYYADTPFAVNVDVTADGAVLIYSGDFYLTHNYEQNYFYADDKQWIADVNTEGRARLWLYSPKPQTPENEDTRIPDKYVIYEVDSSVSEGSIPDGEYVLNSKDYVLSDDIYGGWTIAPDGNLTNAEWAPTGSGYYYNSFDTSTDNILIFTHQGGNKYYIQNKKTGEYVVRSNWALMYGSSPEAFNVVVNDDGSLLIYTVASPFTLYFYRQYEYFELKNLNDEYAVMWLYKPEYPADDSGNSGNSGNSGTANASHKALYDILHEGIGYDYASYTKATYEKLLTELEKGVEVYKKSDASDAEYAAATAAIRAAIDALSLDVKKISGTLFKYGYNNSTGTADYSVGGTMMNDIAIRQMKTAIYSDENILNQIKDIIGYNDASYGWTGDNAKNVLDKAVELYAKIYTLLFTGVAYDGASDRNAVSNYNAHGIDSTVMLLTPWNIWTKDETHGANDPAGVHDGASVQGLASATLDKSVITSHAAYMQELSYANDGPPDTDLYDVEKYTFYFDTGTYYKEVQLEYLTGISVYFPDLFTRESLDASGNVTTATTGKFSKYYWDTEFPMFISTDEYGVNTYHYDSKDTQYLIQASFNDAQHTVDMELNDVGVWAANGPNNGNGSGFFPFNYKQGTTTYTGESAVYHYGFTFEHNFYIPKGGKHVNGEDVIFSFSGDDDVYVYIDGVLVLDNGGLHGAREATINFTNCTVNYQYAMDVADGQLKGDEYETTYSYNDYIEKPDATVYNADTIAAIEKLHEVISDGEVHTLNFFYLERGASDSNCKISFNLSETSEEVRIIDQNLTLDYGLPVEYDIKSNNNISEAAQDNGVKVEYLGICAVNQEYTPTYTFEKPLLKVTFEEGKTYTVEGMKYGTCTVDNKGNVSYTLESMNMKESENFYVVAKITGDPTYAEEVVYYQIEKTTFIPASAIYYEDTFDTITYTNGKVPSNYDNEENQFGIWQKKGKQETSLKQTADLTDSEANPYGYETNYSSFADYSGGSVRYVDVATKNNPNKKFSGGTGAAWPTVEFTFTGTGFDLISVTDNTTGAFSVVVKDADNKPVRSTVVDTFYGYNYGRIYADADGNLTLDDKNTPMYREENGTTTSAVRYYDENGAITDVAHYLDADGNVVETQTDNPNYAYAYGWVVADSEDDPKETLYQIPVIKITDLEYGSYSVVITPTFTSGFGHSSVAEDGTNYYSVYLDAIKIYSPAGVGDDIKDKEVKKAYSTDDELYPSYLEIKDMLIGADSLSETDKQGIIFIDGIAALNNDIETYKTAGPNNELYLAKDQAVAFEIWATSVPTDVQLGAKLACGKPDLTVSYASNTTDYDIETATDIYYSLNSILPNNAKLTWEQVDGSDGYKYYTTGTVVVQNTGDEGSILSLTNLKWTFSQNGGKGYFRIPTSVEDEVVTVATTLDTQATAYKLMRMRTAALDVEQIEEPAAVTDADGNSTVTVKLRTSADVATIVVADENGDPIDANNVQAVATPVEGEDALEWTVTFTTDKIGTHTYIVAGAYENGYTDLSKTVNVTVTLEKPPVEDEPGDDPSDDPADDPVDDPVDEPDKTFIDFVIEVVEKAIRLVKWLLAQVAKLF